MRNSNSIRRNFKYCCMQGLYWMFSCIAIVFAGIFLLERSYTNSEIGIIMAAGYVLGTVLQPIVAHRVDRSTVHSPVFFLTVTTLVFVAVSVGLLMLHIHSLLLSLLYVLFIAVQLVLQPLVNAYAFYLERLGTEIRFGFARGCGSLFWGVTSTVLGFLTDHFPATVILYAALAVSGLFLLLLLSCAKEGLVPNGAREENKANTLSVRVMFGNYRPFCFLLLGIAALFFGHSFIDNFPFQIVTHVGGDKTQMGVFCFYAAILEMPAMFLFEAIHKRFSTIHLLKFGTVFFVVKNCLTWMVSSLTGLYLANAFQAISFAIVVPAAVRYADESIDKRYSNTAQAMLTAVMTIGNILSSLLGGWIMDVSTVSGMLFVGALAALAGAIAILCGMPWKATQKA